jgi:hypothetical protein
MAKNGAQARFPPQNGAFTSDASERAVIIHLLFQALPPTVSGLSFKGHHKCGPML